MNDIKKLILLGIILNIVFSGTLAYSTYTKTTICLPGFDCDSVQNSKYGSIFGVKLSTLGIFCFSALLIVFLIVQKYPQYRYFYLGSATFGALGAASFLVIQFFVLKKVCSSCLAIDLLMLAIAGFSIYEEVRSKKEEFVSIQQTAPQVTPPQESS